MNRSDPGIPFTITPSDSANFTHATRGLTFGTAGTIVGVVPDGSTVTIPINALAAGVVHPVVLTRINLTGTSATPIVGFY